jgi:hypothetical protein
VKTTIPELQNSSNFVGGRTIKKNNFPFGVKLKFQMDFELQTQEVSKI